MKNKPNILMILADQMHADWFGALKKIPVHTPHLDRFAQTATRFNSAYAQNTICTPARVSILSGQYTHNHGYYGLIGPSRPEFNNLFRHFRSAGYRTGAYGKLHLPMDPENWVLHDLDEFEDAYENGRNELGKSNYLSYLEEHGVRELEDSWHNTTHYGKASIITGDAMPSMLPYEHTMEMWSADRAMEFMQASADRPFFVQINFQRPHHPLLPQQQFWDLYQNSDTMPPGWNLSPDGRPPHFQKKWKEWQEHDYDFAQPGDSFEDAVRRSWRGTLACVSQIDDVFGRIMNFLDQSGLTDNTIVIFSSDHGAYHGMFGIMEKSPGICSEAVCRIPLLIRVPQLESQVQETTAFAEQVDFSPTLCAMAELSPMDEADGKDITALLTGGEPVRTESVTENALSKSIRWDNWRFVHYPREMFDGEDVGELYDIANDPLETRNLYNDPQFADRVREGRRRILDWSIRTTRTLTLNRPRPFWPKAPEDIASDQRAPSRLQALNDPNAATEYL